MRITFKKVTIDFEIFIKVTFKLQLQMKMKNQNVKFYFISCHKGRKLHNLNETT